MVLLFWYVEQIRDVDRQMKRTGREIDRDRRELEKEEKKLVNFKIFSK